MDRNVPDDGPLKKNPKMFNLRSLRLSLKYRPDILKLVLKMRYCIRKRRNLISRLKKQLKTSLRNIEHKDAFTQTVDNKENVDSNGEVIMEPVSVREESSTPTLDTKEAPVSLNETKDVKEKAGWDVNDSDEKKKSIADQVKEVAQTALQQSGMVYVESAGMYYDYKTGYYYNSELGLYYHTDTECYYYYSEEKQNFVFHSYPDRRAMAENNALKLHEKKKAKKHKKDKEDTNNQESQPKRRKTTKQKIAKKKKTAEGKDISDKDEKPKEEAMEDKTEDILELDDKSKEKIDNEPDDEKEGFKGELEDGECSDSCNEESDSEDAQSDTSTSTASDDETVAKHLPPCMRVIVKESNLPKLKVGSLYLVTKDGGTIGREGDQHAILLRDTNVSRNHLDIRYDLALRKYVIMDLGSKNGTILNGTRMSDSQVVSKPMEVIHGSILQIGETKLLCHIHPGKDTCGHCEPGLLMETQEKEKKLAYTRTCSVQKQHQLELARLKNKYAPQPLAIEETAYNDRAQQRREAVGSSHHAEKTQSADVDTFIAPENKGFKLLEKMGWSKGEGLGKDNQGDTEPIPLVNNEGKSGLGATGEAKRPVPSGTLGPATMRLVNKTKMLRPPAKAFQNEDDDNLDSD